MARVTAQPRRAERSWQRSAGFAITQGHGAFGTAEFADGFGTSLAAGDLNSDTFDDLVIGTPGEDAGSVTDVGVVDVLTGAADLTQMQDHYFAAGDLAMAANRRLGANVAVQEFGGAANGWVYAPGHLSSGWIELIDLAHSTVLSQDTQGVFGTSEHGDAFGVSLSVGDFNGDGIDELAVGVPFESVGSIYHAGDLYVFPGDALGLAHGANLGNAQMWYQDTPGIPGTSESRDLWGDLQYGPTLA